jgi:hypothetical protein
MAGRPRRLPVEAAVAIESPLPCLLPTSPCHGSDATC